MTQVGDSSTPPPVYPAADGWGFYVGGDTPHVWTDAEVAALPVRYRLPIFTRSNPGSASQAVADARAALMWAVAHHQPKKTLIGLDFEAAVNAGYVEAFDSTIVAGGYLTLLYGQQSTVLKNPKPSGGYWVADWDGVNDDPSSAGKQYRNTSDWDMSDFATTALWDTRPTTTAPVVAPSVQEDDMLILKVNGQTPIYGFAGGRLWHIADEASVLAYQAAGVKSALISAKELEAIQAAVKA